MSGFATTEPYPAPRIEWPREPNEIKYDPMDVMGIKYAVKLVLDSRNEKAP
jgi:hypothetical protein